MSELSPTPEHLMDPYVIQLIEALSMQQDEIERLQSRNRWAKLDIAELIDDFGVHPLYWNGVWQACLNETNVPVEHFKSEQDCREWCDKENKDAIETPTMKIESLSSEGGRKDEIIAMLRAAARTVCDDADYIEKNDVCEVSVSSLEHLENVLEHIRIFPASGKRSEDDG